MQVVALLAQKGGVGKTSIALALAVEASAEGRTVVVLDADRDPVPGVAGPSEPT